MSPRSILKSDFQKSSNTKSNSHVHFPPSPSQLVSATYYAHSAAHYDRSPLIVAPNDCAIPRRNCPERTYVLCDREARLLTQVDADYSDSHHHDANVDYTPRSSSYHQRVDYFSSPSHATSFYSSQPPHCVPDLTWSESEDSDGLISPPVNVDFRQSFSSLNISSPNLRARIQKPLLSSPTDVPPQDVLSFLPHPPLPPHERKRSLSPRNRERKERTTYSSSDSDGPVFTTTRTKPLRPRYSTTSSSFSSDIPPDSGCFGGF
ncbi:hypothetical protein Clacol_007477 [Clathrus columnatus]|uniref:Uncharacterized protein n=1 Tax=Clathrus columnatus TaxID=1419009 RepID=A0AAV5AJV9_9AGAM|nr:hypothetical protein Clacol_007477 [Clathrus columnatus]